MLGKKIKELRLISGLTQEDVALKTGLTQRTIQRIENHEVEPSEYSLNQIGEVFKVNLNKMKLDEKNKKQKWLNIFLVSISLLIIFNFAVGWFTWQEHWYVLPAWFFPILAGVSIPYFKKKQKRQAK